MSKYIKESEKKAEKELKIEKLEKPELKEKPEKGEGKEKLEFTEVKARLKEKIEIKEQHEKAGSKELKDQFKEELKEQKEKPERKEFKEPIKEKVEFKELKDFEKQTPEKGGKELAENDPGDMFGSRGASSDPGAAAKPKETDKAFKEMEKFQKDKEVPEKIQKDTPEKFHKDKDVPEKIQKDVPEKFQKDKDVPEKFQKDVPEKFHKDKDVPEKIQKDVPEKIKPEKEFKIEKNEIKDLKIEQMEKFYQKDLLPEKQVFESDPKGFVENPLGSGPSVDPTTKTPMFTATGNAEDRLAQLEDAVTRLSHFIGVDLRPDLSSGALKDEPDVSGEPTSDEAMADDKTKKPK